MKKVSYEQLGEVLKQYEDKSMFVEIDGDVSTLVELNEFYSCGNEHVLRLSAYNDETKDIHIKRDKISSAWVKSNEDLEDEEVKINLGRGTNVKLYCN